MKKNNCRNASGWILTILLVVVTTATVQAAPGDLDTTFNGTGKLRVAVGGGDDYGNAVARQSDGKLIVAGRGEIDSHAGFSLVRYNANGTLDTAFGTGGIVQTIIGSMNSEIFAVVVLADNKILAAGYAADRFAPATADFALVKYNSNGTLDTTFGTGGIVTTDFLGNDDFANAMLVQPDGKIVLAGSAASSSTFSFGALARYTTTGALDTSFSSDGKVTTVYTDSASDKAAVIFNGKIYVGGDVTGNGGFNASYLTCYNSDGSLNTAFDGDGTAYLSSSGFSRVNSLAVLRFIAGEEKIIVAGSVFSASSVPNQTLWSYDANNGSLDNSFGSGGRATLNVAGTSSSTVRILNSTGVASRLIVAGTIKTGTGATRNNNFLVARYQLNGTLDTAFDGDGIATADINSDDFGSAMLIQPTDNKIIVAGWTTVRNFSTTDHDFGIVRFNTNGALDTIFDGDGKRFDDISNGLSSVRATKIQADGKIVVAGNAGGSGSVARFNPDGTYDTTFGEGGKKKIPLCCVVDAAIQPDGKVVLASALSQFAVYRLNADGSPDTTFDGDGFAFAQFGGAGASLYALAIQSDGAIILVGSVEVSFGVSYSFAVARLLSNGTLDTTFDSDGKVTTPISSGYDIAKAVVIQSDGKIVVAGNADNNANSSFAVVRYNANGSLDTTFSGDGKLTTPIGTSYSTAEAVALQMNGKIIAAGYASNGSNFDFAAARYNADGSLDTTFDGDGKVITPIGTRADFGNAITIQSDGKILIVGSTEDASGNTDFAVVRYSSDGSLFSTFGNGGKVVVDFSSGDDSALAIALDSSGRAVVAGQADGLFGIARLLNVAPTAADVSISGRVLTPKGRGLTNVTVLLTDGSGSTRSARTTAFGYYRFDDVAAGQTYILNVSSKRYQFNPQVLLVTEDLENLNFFAAQSNSKLSYEY